MIDLQLVTQFMIENFENVSISEGGKHFHARCPLCGDSKKSKSKKRFHLNWRNGEVGWNCFNCGRHGGIISIFMNVKGVSKQDARNYWFKFNPDSIKSQLNKTPLSKKPIFKPSVAHNYILKDCVSEDLKVDSILYDKWVEILSKFRKDRKIPNDYKLYFAYDGDYKNRIIIPIFDKYNDIIYFQGRRIPETSVQPKYLNPKIEKSSIILNSDKFRRDRSIIITEGLIDAFMIGNQGTTCLGKEISEYFIKNLRSYTSRDIILAFDNDEEGMKSMKKFIDGNKYSKEVKYFILPDKYKDCKDINKLQVDHSIENMYEFVIKNSYDYFEVIFVLEGLCRK